MSANTIQTHASPALLGGGIYQGEPLGQHQLLVQHVVSSEAANNVADIDDP